MATYQIIQVNSDGSETNSIQYTEELAPAPTLGGTIASLNYQNPDKWFYATEVDNGN